MALYSRLQPRRLEFHLLHAEDGFRVRQHMIHPVTRHESPPAEIRKGYPIDARTYVLVTPTELGALEPTAFREIEITRFVPADVLAPAWFVRPYQLGPDGDIAAYFALVEAMRREQRIGIARWTLRKRRYVGALSFDGDTLRLTTLRPVGEVVIASELGPPSGRAPDRRELSLAEQLVSALAGDFDPTEFRDEHRERVLGLIHAKAEGHLVPLRPTEAVRPSEKSLAEALRASLTRAKTKPESRREEASA